MRVEPIEGESIDVFPVHDYVGCVYAAMQRADSAGYVQSTFSSLVDRLEALEATAGEMARYRRTVEKGTLVVERVKAESIRAASLTPRFFEAAAFDSALDRFTMQWALAGAAITRVNKGWDQLITSVIPAARDAAGFAAAQQFAAVRAGSVGSDTELTDEDAVDMLELALSLLATGDAQLERRDVVRVTSLESTIGALAGPIAHVVARAPAMVTMRPVDRPNRFVRLSILLEDDGLIESVGNHGLEESDRLTTTEKRKLAELGLGPPTRRGSERNWRLRTPGTSIPGIAEAMLAALWLAHGVNPKDRVEIVTERIE